MQEQADKVLIIAALVVAPFALASHEVHS